MVPKLNLATAYVIFLLAYLVIVFMVLTVRCFSINKEICIMMDIYTKLGIILWVILGVFGLFYYWLKIS